MKYYVLFHEPGEVNEKAPLYAEAHRAWFEKFHRNGTLVMIGPFANAQEEGAMSIFTSREAAEEFARGDPFVLNGVVSNWFVREWDEVLVP
jgi:uncharacterized protein YciI